MSGIYRRQWSGVPVDYRTLGIAADMKLMNDQLPNGYFGGGLVLHSDKAGDGDLGLTEVNILPAYTQQLSDQLWATVGASIGMSSITFSPDQVIFGNQNNGDQRDPSVPSGESFTSSTAALDIGAGLNLSYNNYDGKAYLNWGVGLYHLNKPSLDLSNGNEWSRPVRTSSYLFGGYNLNDLNTLLFHGLFQLQTEQNELVLGTGWKYNFSEMLQKPLAVQLTATYRHSANPDAIIPAIGIHYGPWLLGFSYDVNISDFETATGGAGGPELALRYVYRRISPLKEFKSCPIF